MNTNISCILGLIHVEFGIKLIFKLIITVLRVNLRKIIKRVISLSGENAETLDCRPNQYSNSTPETLPNNPIPTSIGAVTSEK